MKYLIYSPHWYGYLSNVWIYDVPGSPVSYEIVDHGFFSKDQVDYILSVANPRYYADLKVLTPDEILIHQMMDE